MLRSKKKKMITKASANRSFPIPNEGGFSPPGGGVFKSVVIRSPSPPGQTPESIHPLVAKLCGRKAPCRKGCGKMGMDGKENRTLPADCARLSDWLKFF